MTKKKESINNEEVIELGEKEKLTEILSECYEVAEVECKKENIDDLIVDIGEEDSKVIIELANTKHACRGAALTLAIWVLAGIYADEGKSGTSYIHRAEFNRMMEDCRQGKIQPIRCITINTGKHGRLRRLLKA